MSLPPSSLDRVLKKRCGLGEEDFAMALQIQDPAGSRIHIRSGCAFNPVGRRPLDSYDRIVGLFDPAVSELARRIIQSFAGEASIPIQAREQSKSLSTVEAVCQQLRELGCSRRSLLVNVGGGCITDVGGFVAAIYMRGIEHVHVPTTLLAMCDASIGAKTGVNLGREKNLIGAFHPAVETLIDPDILQAVPQPILCEGLVEVIKIAAILDARFFEWLEHSLDRILERDPPALRFCLERSIQIKCTVVEEDAREHDRRRLLNFGHTIGHGLEAVSSHRLCHGEAVSLGMMRELELANCSERARVGQLLQRIGMPTEFPRAIDADALWKSLLCDKKVDRGRVVIAVPRGLGQGQIVQIERGDL
ncbi:MAG: 3-dehydroquinate synthase family protein [Planctomycetota bacterium]